MCPFGTLGLALGALRMPNKWLLGIAQSHLERLEVQFQRKDSQGRPPRLA